MGANAFVVRWRLANDALLTLTANLSDQPVDGFEIERGAAGSGLRDRRRGRRLSPWSVLWTIVEVPGASRCDRSPRPLPRATYRLQLHKGFRFGDVAAGWRPISARWASAMSTCRPS